MQLIDNFYNDEEWLKVNALLNVMKFTPTSQPEYNTGTIDNRMKGYPCYETKQQPRLFELEELLKQSLQRHTMYKIKHIKTAFRKIYTEELKKSPLKNVQSPIHRDFHCDIAGVVYFDGLTIQGGTSLFFNEDFNTQFEPDVIYAARPNRAILYNAETLHCANHDSNYDFRTIQTIFLKLE
jgi:hypothetical protein